MANPKDDQPDFEELDDLFSEEQAEATPAAEGAATAGASPDAADGEGSDLPDLEGLDALGGDAALADWEGEAEPAEDDTEGDPKKKKKKKQKKKKEKAEKAKKQKAAPAGPKPGFVEAVLDASPYTVMLGIALVAIVIAIFCLAMEWKSYEFDTSAKGYKPLAAAIPAVQFGPANTAVAVCPCLVRLTSKAGAAVDESGFDRIT